MKSYFGLFLLLISSSIFAQRFGYIDTDKILGKMPDYKKAIGIIEEKLTLYTKEIEELKSKNALAKEKLEKEKQLLLIEQIVAKEEEINQQEKEIERLEDYYFNAQKGLVLKLKESLIKPLKDKILNALEKISEQERYGFIFDKDQIFFISKIGSKFDLTKKVEKLLGI